MIVDCTARENYYVLLQENRNLQTKNNITVYAFWILHTRNFIYWNKYQNLCIK